MIVESAIFHEELYHRAMRQIDVRIGGKPRYWYPERKVIEDILWQTFFERYKYKLGEFECEDFTDILQGFLAQEYYVRKWEAPLAKGMCWLPSREHAVNFIRFIDPDGFMLVDGQNDKITEWDPIEKASYIRA